VTVCLWAYRDQPCWCSKLRHNIDAPIPPTRGIWVYLESTVPAYARFMVTASSIDIETTEAGKTTATSLSKKKEHTTSLHTVLWWLIFQYASFDRFRLHFFLAAWPVIGIWFTSQASTHKRSTWWFPFNQSMVTPQVV